MNRLRSNTLTGMCLVECDTGWDALALAIRMTRLKLIEAGTVVPVPGERLPSFLRRRLERLAA